MISIENIFGIWLIQKISDINGSDDHQPLAETACATSCDGGL
jgi:hypothetical protein